MIKPDIRSLLVFFFLAVVALAMISPIFREFDNWGVQDWDQHLFYHAVSRDSILRYHQFPLWNPYGGGGMVDLANPQSRVASPTFIIILILGVVRGIKIEIWLHLFLGLSGMYLLSRHLLLARAPAIFSSSLFMLSSVYAVNLAPGMTWIMSIAYLPWVFLFFIRAFKHFYFIFLSGFFLALMFLGGGVYPLSITILFLAVYSFCSIILRKTRFLRTTGILSVALVSMVLIGAVKFFPAIEFMRGHPRRMDDYSGFSLQSFSHALFSPDQTYSSTEGISPEPGFFRGISYAIDENGIYLGIVPVILALVGLASGFRKRPVLALILLIFLWLSFGNRITPSLWKWIHELPVYSSMRVAQRFRIILLFSLAIFGGYGLQWIADSLPAAFRRRPGVVTGLLSIVIAVTLLDFCGVNRRIWAEAFTIPPQATEERKEFHQIIEGPSHYNRDGIVTGSADLRHAAKGWLYPAFLSNIGVIDGYESAEVARNAIPISSDRYRGEVFLSGTDGSARFLHWSPNRFAVEVNARQPGYVIINQNSYPGWRVAGVGNLAIESREGLLAAKIPAGITRLEVYYLPVSFISGLIVSAISCLVFGYLLVRYRKINNV